MSEPERVEQVTAYVWHGEHVDDDDKNGECNPSQPWNNVEKESKFNPRNV